MVEGIRLIENVHREDLSDAEKGDAVIELADFTGKSYKDLAETELTVSYQSVRNWVYKANRTSKKLRQCLESQTLSDEHTFRLLKYSPDVQDLLALFIVDWNQKRILRKSPPLPFVSFRALFESELCISLLS